MSWFKRSRNGRAEARAAGLKFGMSKKEVLRRLGEPARRSSTDEVFGSLPGRVVFVDKPPERAELWLYDDLPEAGKSSMVRFVKGRVRGVHVK